ncbi:hypothetical protein [Pelagibaculum spongiae]|uniref:Uncharacterized protein n=1 Tax=Pelagibaculum spongiae TaxID=2080658 RepID=A0A2V1H5T3_9GAMM|nr:hypothetical protein [Pelagibaculum spongiae]PVZ72115.1 hypothetical protein DC094_03615 [Pelagibaculum spongiae]
MKPHALIALLLLAVLTSWSFNSKADPSAENRLINSLKKNPNRFPSALIARLKMQPSQSVALAEQMIQAFPKKGCEIIGVSYQYLSDQQQKNYFADITARVIHFQPEKSVEMVRCAISIDPWLSESIVLASLLQAPSYSGLITQAAYDSGASLEMVSNAVTLWMHAAQHEPAIELEAEQSETSSVFKNDHKIKKSLLEVIPLTAKPILSDVQLP